MVIVNIINNIWHVAVGILLLIAATIMIGSCDAWIAGKFDIRVFFKGIIKGIIIALCCIMVYTAGYLNPDVTFSFNGTAVTLMSAMMIFMIAAYGAYALKMLQKLYKLFKLDTSSVLVSETEVAAGGEPDNESDTETQAVTAEQ